MTRMTRAGIGSHGGTQSCDMAEYDLIYCFHPNSGKSVCVRKDAAGDKLYLPLSQIEILTPPEQLVEGGICRIAVRNWLAEEKGLA